jgi:predicted transcriptional regulator
MSPEERAAYRAARERGRQAIAEGRIINGDKVLAWLDDLAAGRNVTAPEPEPVVSPRVVP